MRDNLMRQISRWMFRVMAYHSPVISVPPQGVTLKKVTIINPGQGRIPEQMIRVEGDCITQISHDLPASSLPVVDCSGGFALPGLIDMHVHIPPLSRELANLLFLSYGVTTIRETGDADGSTWEGRRQIRVGQVPGPRIFASGAVLDGQSPFLPTSWGLNTPGEARDAVARLAALGADFIKIHHKLSEPVLVAICEAAAARGLRVVGHVPSCVPFERAGIWDVQHLDGIVPYPAPGENLLDVQKKWIELTSDQIDAYVKSSLHQGLVHTPTLVSEEALVRMADPCLPDDPAIALLPRYYRDGIWNRKSMPLFSRFMDDILLVMKQAMERSLEVVRRLSQAGVRIHLGTDTVGMPFLVPGASLHREMALMVASGLNMESVWTAGTSAAGKSLGMPLLGTVQEGAPADLLIFGEDPTDNLTALSTLKGVVAAGRYYPKVFLDEAWLRHRKCFERPGYEAFMTTFIRLSLKLMMKPNL
jgi:hypothetical protein